MKFLYTILQIILFLFFISINMFPQNSGELNENESANFTFGIENDLVTRYIWNGLNCNNGIINQPTLWLKYNDFTFFSWASFTHHEFNDDVINNEIDLAVQYSKEINSVYLETSLTYIYALLTNAPATTEAYLKISYEIVDVELFSDFTLDVMEYSGSLSGNVGINKKLFENDNLSILSGVCIGWANKKFNENYIGVLENIKPFNYSCLSVEANYYITEMLYIKPHLEYVYLFSPVFKSVSGNTLTNLGIAIGIEL